MKKILIDVSEHQGIIDWGKVMPHIDGAILRCGYGGDYEDQDDEQFKRNADECTRLGIPFGVYIYSYAKSIQGAQYEADHVLRLIKNYELAYPVYLDLEESGTESKRVTINANGIEGQKIMVDPYTEAGSGDDAGKTITATKNQEIIYFPEAETGAGGTAVGFGLFSAKTGGYLYMWGELKSEVTIGQYSVPMFRANDFILKLK